jgi:wyosine [tRNA(Phe)-imidazoG37] synthetase (radical SAM superfamily)
MTDSTIQDKQGTSDFIQSYIKSNYRIVGKNKHSAIKPCHWLEQKLLTGRSNRNCYKEVFGVESHRCLQNTPSLPFCNHQCVFCWRDIENSLDSEFSIEPDDPADLVEEMLRHQRNIVKQHLPLKRYLFNYEIMIDILHYMSTNKKIQQLDTLATVLNISKNKAHRALNLLKNQEFIALVDTDTNAYKLDADINRSLSSRDEIELLVNRELTTPKEIMKTHNEALNPNHAAISLDGEPLLYPKMSGLVHEFRKRGMTTFIVTNSTMPEKIEQLDSLPSQFYFTLPAPNEEIYKRTCRPMVRDGWERIHKTFELVDSLSTRTLIRLTAIKNLNLREEFLDDYIKIVEEANPNFFEIKGFTLQAKALEISERLKTQKPVKYYFPTYPYLEDIAEEFEKRSGFPIIYRNERSRDFLFAVNWPETKDPTIKTP